MQMDREQMNLIQREQNFAQQQTGIMKEQLNLDKELDLIEHLLKGEERYVDEGGDTVWGVPENKDIRILSDLGLKLVMNTLNFYLNKNTLLSNYDEDTINKKMEDFSESLNDALFMSYEKYFLQPTKEECQKKLLEKINDLTKDRIFYLELKHIDIPEEEIREEIISSMDIEREILNIREALQKEKLKGFEHLMRKIQDTVHSAYLRAWNGQERKSLRQHMHISESIMPPQKHQGGSNVFKRMFS
jgi:hypothetical protein